MGIKVLLWRVVFGRNRSFLEVVWKWYGETYQVHVEICVPGIRAYEQLGYRAFGMPGKMAAGIAITLQNIGGKEPLQGQQQ